MVGDGAKRGRELGNFACKVRPGRILQAAVSSIAGYHITGRSEKRSSSEHSEIVERGALSHEQTIKGKRGSRKSSISNTNTKI
jgi:hypothetical protein